MNRALSFLYGGSLEITLTVPLSFLKLNLTSDRLMALNMPVNYTVLRHIYFVYPLKIPKETPFFQLKPPKFLKS